MSPTEKYWQHQTRRAFFKRTGLAAGRIALGSLLFPELFRSIANASPVARTHPGLPGLPHFAPKARRLIYLFMNGAPSQIDLWDYKPGLAPLFTQVSVMDSNPFSGKRVKPCLAAQSRVIWLVWRCRA